MCDYWPFIKALRITSFIWHKMITRYVSMIPNSNRRTQCHRNACQCQNESGKSGRLFINRYEMSVKHVALAAAIVTYCNSWWFINAIWRHRTGPALAQVMACCLTAPSHYLNQCWLIKNEVPWQLPGAISLGIPQLWIAKTSLKLLF